MITNSTSMDAAVAIGIVGRDRQPDRGGRRHPASTTTGAPATYCCPSRSRSDDPFADIDPPPIRPSASCRTALQQSSPTTDPDDRATTRARSASRRSERQGQRSTLDARHLYHRRRLDVEHAAQANVTCNGCTFVLTNSDRVDRDDRQRRHQRRRARSTSAAPTPAPTRASVLSGPRAPTATTTQQDQRQQHFDVRGRVLLPAPEVEFNGTAGHELELPAARRSQRRRSRAMRRSRTIARLAPRRPLQGQARQVGGMMTGFRTSRARRARRGDHRAGAGRAGPGAMLIGMVDISRAYSAQAAARAGLAARDREGHAGPGDHRARRRRRSRPRPRRPPASPTSRCHRRLLAGVRRRSQRRGLQHGLRDGQTYARYVYGRRSQGTSRRCSRSRFGRAPTPTALTRCTASAG